MRVGLVRTLTALTVLGSVALVPARHAPAAENAEVVLPAEYGTGLPQGSTLVVGGPTGVVWHGTDAQPGQPIRLYRHDTKQTTRLTELEDFAEVGTVVGNQYAWAAMAGKTMGVIDLSTGEKTALTPPAGHTFLGGTGEGYATYLQEGAAQATVAHHPTGLGLPRSWTTKGTFVGGVADPTSVLVSVLDGKRRPFLLDHTTGTERAINAQTGAEPNALALDAQRAYWVTPSGQLQSADRADAAAPLTTATLPGTGAITHLAASDGTVAFVRTVGDYFDATTTIATGPAGGPFTLVTAPIQGTARVFDAGGGSFTVHTRGNDFITEKVQALASGATKLGPSLVALGVPIPAGLAATTGRLLDFRSSDQGADLHARAVVLNADGALVVGTPALVKRNASPFGDQSSGSRTVFEAYSAKGNSAVVLEGSKETARFPIREGAFLSLSGSRVLATYRCGLGCDPGFVQTGQVHNLNGGKPVAVPYTSVLFGDHIAYVLDNGEVRYRRVGSTAEQVLRPAGPPVGNTAVSAEETALRIAGDWVLWCIPRQTDVFPALADPLAEIGAVNVRTGQRVDLTATVKVKSSYSYTDLVFADGRVAWIDRDDRTVRLMDLADSAVRDLGKARPDYNTYVALTDEFVAWVAPDDTIHLLPLDPIGSTRYLGGVAPAVFSPALSGTAGDWRARLEVSRPLTSWKVELAGAGGVVRTFTGSSSTGSVRATWDGNNAAGKRVPDGSYTWTLTGTGATGDLPAAKGTVRVDTTTPTPKLTFPTSGTVAKGFVGKWSSTEKGVKYTVKVALGTPSGSTVKYSSAKTWLNGTTATTATYKGTKIPYALKANRYYRFTVTATDAYGNARSAPTKTVRVPK